MTLLLSALFLVALVTAMSTGCMAGSARTFRKIAAGNLFVSEPAWWLKSRFHFSFAGYYNPKNMNFGVLRVLNDDEVKPTGGFPTHPHNDMEILSYVVKGHLTHKDSMGSAETIGRGAIQYMSAGSGVTHSEFNSDTNGSLRFLQLWIEPTARHLKPNYGSRSFDAADRLNKLHHVVGPVTHASAVRSGSASASASSSTAGSASGGDSSSAEEGRRPTELIRINQDANIFISEIESGHEVSYLVAEGRQVYLVCIEGDLTFTDEVRLTERDAVEIIGPVELTMSTARGGHLLMVEMAHGDGMDDDDED